MYKEIVLKYNDKLDDKDLLAIKLFNESFKINEIQLEHDNNRVIVLLREIDINKLQDKEYIQFSS